MSQNYYRISWQLRGTLNSSIWKFVVCWYWLEKMLRFLARCWEECGISGFVFRAIPSNFTRKLCHPSPSWKMWHVQHRNAHAHVLTPALQWLCMRQPHSPELLLFQRRASYWRRETLKRLLITSSISSFHWNHSSALRGVQGNSSTGIW